MNICFNLLYLKYSKYKLENEFFSWYWLNTHIFSNSNIGTVNAIQKKFVYLYKMGEQIKSSPLIKIYCSKLILQFHLPTIQLFISTWRKSYEDIYHSPPHVYVITGNILITIDNKICPLLASSSHFMTDS